VIGGRILIRGVYLFYEVREDGYAPLSESAVRRRRVCAEDRPTGRG